MEEKSQWTIEHDANIEVVDKTGKRSEMGYYMCMTKKKTLHDEMRNRYKKYVTYNFLKQCIHEFDTQMNEGMNK